VLARALGVGDADATVYSAGVARIRRVSLCRDVSPGRVSRRAASSCADRGRRCRSQGCWDQVGASSAL